MLKLTLHPGDFIDIGADIRVVFSGGSANNIHLLVDAPKEMNIARSTANGRNDAAAARYEPERKLSPRAQKEIVDIIRREKKTRNQNKQVTQ